MRSKYAAYLFLGFLMSACLLVFGFLGEGPGWFPEWRSERPNGPTAESRRIESEAREKLAFQSLDDRIPTGKPIPLTSPLSAAASKRLDLFESNVDYSHARLARILEALHEKTQDFFVQSPGFGGGRTLPDEHFLLQAMEEDKPPPPQPGSPAFFPVSSEDAVVAVEPDEDHHFYHDGASRDFLYPQGFGYFKDRRHVAGFRPHGVRHLGVALHPSWKWRIHHVLLVGIQMHERPVVYATDQLPSMEQVRKGKTRLLDAFEESGLAAMKKGEDLYLVRQNDTLRMFGSLRATRQCLKCHDAKRGDLLGALSYTLRPAPPPERPEIWE